MKTKLLSALILLLSVEANAQLINPGDPAILYHRVRPYRNLYKYTLVDKAGKKLEELVGEDVIKIDTASGQLIRVQNCLLPGFILEDTAISELSTLRPIRMTSHFLPYTDYMRFQYEGNKAYASTLRKGVQKDTVNIMPDGYFDSNLQSYLITLIDYAKTKKISFYGYNFEIGGKYLCEVDLLRKDILTVKGVKKNVYVVRTTDKLKGLTTYNWIDQKDATLLKGRMVFSNGDSYQVERL